MLVLLEGKLSQGLFQYTIFFVYPGVNFPGLV